MPLSPEGNLYICNCDYLATCSYLSGKHTQCQIRPFKDFYEPCLLDQVIDDTFDAVMLFQLKLYPEWSAVWIVQWVEGVQNRAEVIGVGLLERSILLNLHAIRRKFELQ